MKTLIYNAVLTDSAGTRHGWVLFDHTGLLQSGTGEPAPCTLGWADETVDAEGASVIPGLADTHVHFRQPGMEHKGDMLTEGRAAVAGGVTTVFDMPNTRPATTTVEALEEKRMLAAASGAPCRIIPLLGVVPGAMKDLRRLDPASTPAVKMFLGTSTGAMTSPAGKELEDVFRFLADTRIPLIVHAEDNDIIARNMADAVARYGSVEAVPVSMHSVIRSREACLRSSAAAVELAHRFGTRLHIAHVSTADEVRELLTPGPTASKLVTAETTPLYLDPVLCHAEARTCRHKVNPAIKTEADATALRKALASGAVDTIGTDHAPHLLSEKELPGMTAMSGAPSVQFALPLMLTYLPLGLIVDKMTAGPRTIFGIDTPAEFTPGSRADIAVIRETPEYTIADSDAISRCAWTPFAGRTLRHKIIATYVGGTKVYGSAE